MMPLMNNVSRQRTNVSHICQKWNLFFFFEANKTVTDSTHNKWMTKEEKPALSVVDSFILFYNSIKKSAACKMKSV